MSRTNDLVAEACAELQSTNIAGWRVAARVDRAEQLAAEYRELARLEHARVMGHKRQSKNKRAAATAELRHLHTAQLLEMLIAGKSLY